MRALLQRGEDMKLVFQLGHPGAYLVIGLLQLRRRFLVDKPSGLPAGVDARRWQPLVPLLIRSFQLARDILLALPLSDHVALQNELYMTGLRVNLDLLIRFTEGGSTGQVWRFRCGLEAMKLVLDPEGAVQRFRSLRDSVEPHLLHSALHCMKTSIGECDHLSAIRYPNWAGLCICSVMACRIFLNILCFSLQTMGTPR